MRKAIATLCLLLLPLIGLAQSGASSFINGVTHDGQSITCDLPGNQHIKNIGSRIDSAGMCVFSSIEMSALYQGLEQMRGWRNWCAQNYRGGGWPEKVDSCLAAWFKTKNIAPLPYIQYQGRNPENILDLCEKTGRMASMTYGYSPRYGGPIQHMVCNVMFRQNYGVVLDNNFPGEDRYEWVTRQELVRRTIYPNKSAWVFVWVAAPPPPSPRNR